MEEPNIPRIEIRIRRLGDYLQLEIGNLKLKLKSIGNQTYDLVTLEQFVTMAAKKAYQNVIDRERVKQDLKSALEWDNSEGKNEIR